MDQLLQRMARMEALSTERNDRSIEINTKLDKVVDMLNVDRIASGTLVEIQRQHTGRLDDHDDDLEAILDQQKKHEAAINEAKTAIKVTWGIAGVIGAVIAASISFASAILSWFKK